MFTVQPTPRHIDRDRRGELGSEAGSILYCQLVLSRLNSATASASSRHQLTNLYCITKTRQPSLALIGWRSDASVGKMGQCRATGDVVDWRRTALVRRDPRLCLGYTSLLRIALLITPFHTFGPIGIWYFV